MMQAKRVFFIVTSASLIFFACQKKALPVITERKTDLPIKAGMVYPPKETVAPDTVAGKRIYMARCGRCHDLPVVTQYSQARWDLILPTMLPRARVDNEQALHVRTWVLANAGK